ncbi:hypothetical protein HDU93_005506, partial [Gonapodya sp. JEL0774]
MESLRALEFLWKIPDTAGGGILRSYVVSPSPAIYAPLTFDVEMSPAWAAIPVTDHNISDRAEWFARFALDKAKMMRRPDGRPKPVDTVMILWGGDFRFV